MTEKTLVKKSKPRADVETLLALYKKESLLQQKILQIKALLFFTRPIEDILTVLSLSKLRAPDGKKFNSSNLTPLLYELRDKGLLAKDFNCHPLIVHAVTQDAIRAQETDTAFNLSMLTPFFTAGSDYCFEDEDLISNVRFLHLTVHLNQPKPFLNPKLLNPKYCRALINDLISAFYIYSLDREWIATRHPVIQLYLLCAKLKAYYADINCFPPDLAEWVHFFRENDCIAMAVQNNLNGIPLLMSRILQLSLALKPLSYMKQHISSIAGPHYFYHEVEGILAFFNQDKARAIQHYEKANKLFTPLLNKHEWFEENLHGIFYVLTLLSQTAANEELKKAAAAITSYRKIEKEDDALLHILNALLHLKYNDREKAFQYYERAINAWQRSWLNLPLLIALIGWTEVLLAPENLPKLTQNHQKMFQRYRECHHYLAAQIYAELVQLYNKDDKQTNAFFKDISPFGEFKFINILQVKQPWECAIDHLHYLLTDKLVSQQISKDRRIIWLIDPNSLHIEVVEQSLLKSGAWSFGRVIPLKKVYEIGPALDYLTPSDQAAIAGLRCETRNWYGHEEFIWDPCRTLTALIGHPLVFHRGNRHIPIELVKGAVELQVEKISTGYHFSLSDYSTTSTVFLKQETANRYRVIEYSDEIVAICKILSAEGMTVPFQAKDRVINMLCHAKDFIHIVSDITDDDLPIVAGNITPYVHLLPIQDGLRINVWIKPLGEQGTYYRAAHGQQNIVTLLKTEQGEKRVKVVRDFEQEKASINSLIHHCKTLIELNEETDEWCINTLEYSLEAMWELEEYKNNHPLIIEWPKGKTLAIKRTISSKNLSLSIKGSQYWFEYEGEVNIDEEQALDIKKLLDLLGQSHGRFVPLASGEFIALTEKFKKQLEELKTSSDGNKIYHLSASSLRGLADDAKEFKEDHAWASHIKKLNAMEKHQPVLPSTLQAELRDYQKEGFFYLSRLAHWEIGACLADDMGLGKTIQAIALLLSHAPKGPCLVVAPTSVCFVWLEELAKFAPTLVPHILYHANDRKSLIASVGKMDILICSYGLLHQAGDLLLEKEWQMIVLDEAQAIKNSDTKRWKYATQLNSKCRIALTGTPIENHLGELWSIFRFLNPGLLGSLRFFQERFSGPIEKYNDPVAKRALKNVVSPYILRRTKSDVLLELPPKIEQSIFIEPTPEEMAFYEAVRVKALERISELNQQNDKQTKRFSILAEISRLRQACCHASLVDENITIESSKVKSFLALAKNIIDNKHKALIFSQFVRYLDKIKAVLDQEKISYQYLDGGTPLKDRQRAVDEFQSGRGDLFLISLKAGGTGLNLTAADYVIILDPWWNPAVEDQAADRAHRMGQRRPVTVYRMIMKNSIEEKIVTLHKNKKDLASDLLSGSDMTGKISEEELVGLITG